MFLQKKRRSRSLAQEKKTIKKAVETDDMGNSFATTKFFIKEKNHSIRNKKLAKNVHLKKKKRRNHLKLRRSKYDFDSKFTFAPNKKHLVHSKKQAKENLESPSLSLNDFSFLGIQQNKKLSKSSYKIDSYDENTNNIQSESEVNPNEIRNQNKKHNIPEKKDKHNVSGKNKQLGESAFEGIEAELINNNLNLEDSSKAPQKEENSEAKRDEGSESETVVSSDEKKKVNSDLKEENVEEKNFIDQHGGRPKVHIEKHNLLIPKKVK